MANLIDWYVVELKLLLNERMSTARVEQIVMEAEAHLQESVAKRTAEGMTQTDAASAAISAYGQPEKVALGFLKGLPQKLWGINPTWWVGVGCLITIYAWNFHWLTLAGPFDNRGETWQNVLAGLVGLLGLVLISSAARAGLRSYRVVLTGFTLAGACIAVPLLSFWMIPTPGYYQGVSRFHLEQDLPNIERIVTLSADYETYLRRGIRAYASTNSENDLPLDLRSPTLAAAKFGESKLYPAVLGVESDHGGSYVVPRRYGAFFEVDGGSVVLETMATFADAKRHWAEYGPEDLKDIMDQHANFGRLAANCRAAKAGKLFFPNPEMWVGTTMATLVLWPLFLLVDWFAFRTAQPKRRWSRRAIA